MKRQNKRLGILLGIVLISMSIALLVHDANYIFTGNTVDLNEVLKNGEEIPRDKYVTYTCEYPIDNYAEMQTYINGIIPTPFKSQMYSMIDEYSGKAMIFSAKVNKKAKINEFDSVMNDQTESITMVGSLKTISPDCFNYLEENCGFISGDDVTLTYYVIDTTQTRLSLFLIEFSNIALGVFLIIIQFKRPR